MATVTKETLTYESVFAPVQALSADQQVRLIFTLAKQLSPGFQTKLIILLLPDVAPTIEAVLNNQLAHPTAGTTPEDAAQLLKQWWEERATDEDEASWEEIMHRLGAYEKSIEMS